MSAVGAGHARLCGFFSTVRSTGGCCVSAVHKPASAMVMAERRTIQISHSRIIHRNPLLCGLRLCIIRHMRGCTLFLLTACLFAGAKPAGEVQFREHVIESKIPGGYALLITDINKDGKPDIIGLTQRLTELAWYENPTWERHVLIKDMTGLVNMAAADIDGDGIPEIALENEFSMVAAKSPGVVWLLHHQGDPRGL